MNLSELSEVIDVPQSTLSNWIRVIRGNDGDWRHPGRSAYSLSDNEVKKIAIYKALRSITSKRRSDKLIGQIEDVSEYARFYAYPHCVIGVKCAAEKAQAVEDIWNAKGTDLPEVVRFADEIMQPTILASLNGTVVDCPDIADIEIQNTNNSPIVLS